MGSRGSREETARRLAVVVIGAGGLQAVRDLATMISADGKTAWVLWPTGASAAAGDLARELEPRARVGVMESHAGTVLRPGIIHVLADGLTVQFGPEPIAAQRPSPAADVPASWGLEELIPACADGSVSVILAGECTAVRDGIAAIRAAQGLVVGIEAEAVTRDVAVDVDAHGSAQEVAEWMSDARILADALAAARDERSESACREIVRRVAGATGVDFTRYKPATLRRRIQKRYRTLGLPSMESYLEHVAGDPNELHELKALLTVSVSAFFRDAEAFAALGHALREKLRTMPPSGQLRVWVAACATGEEAYSVAILVAEALDELDQPPEARIFATDVDGAAVDFARAGLYPPAALDAVDRHRRERWFARDGRGLRIAKRLRDMCIFANHDIVGQPPFIRLDLISCRNLFIYLNADKQGELLATFHYALNPAGLLFLGQSEWPGRDNPLFDTLDGTHRVFARRPGVRGRSGKRPVSATWGESIVRGRPTGAAKRRGLVDAATDLMTSEFGPAAVLVDGELTLLHFFAGAQRFFALPTDHADFGLLPLVLPELRDELTVLMYRIGQGDTAKLDTLPIEATVDGVRTRVAMGARRISPGGGNDMPGWLVTFTESRVAASAASDPAAATEPADDELARLRGELAESRAQLHAVVVQMESSQAELRSLYEELQASAEELQASNEELQTSNEELGGLNEELQRKTDETQQLNAVLRNIQDSVRASLVVVDRNGRVIRHNAQATRLFGLVEGDLGRSLHDIPCHLDMPRLGSRIDSVIAGGDSVIETVEQGSFQYLMQIDPYRDATERCAGAVLTFADVSDLRRAEIARRKSEARFRRLWEAAQDGFMLVDAEGRVVQVNPALAAMFGVRDGEFAGEKVARWIPSARRERLGLSATVGGSEPRTALMRGVRGDGSEFDIEVGVSSIVLEEEAHLLLSVADVTDRLRADAALRDREQKLSAIVGYSPSALSLKTPDGRYVLANPNLQRLLGLSESEIVGKSDLELYPESIARAIVANDRRALETLERCSVEEWISVDGELRTYMSHIFPVTDERGKPQFVCRISLDVTDQKRSTQALADNQRRLSFAMDAAHAGSWEWSLDIDENNWSEVIAKVYGLDRRHLPSSPAAWRDGVHPHDRERVVEAMRDAAERVAEFEVEWRVNLPDDGRPRFVLSRARPSFGPDGRAKHYIGIVIDITERKRYEHALADSERRLRLALDAAHAGSWEWNLATGENTWSDEIWALYGLARGSASPNFQSWLESIHGDDRDRVVATVSDAARRGDEFETQWQVNLPEDVEARFVMSRGRPIHSDESRVLGYIGIVIDITESKRTEQGLLENKRRLRLALDAAHAGTWEWKVATGENFWSDEIWPLFGLDRESVTPSFEAWRNAIDPDDRDRVLGTISDAAARSAEFETEWRVASPEAASRYLLSRGRPIAGDDGTVSHYIGIVVDITARKQVEVELAAYHTELESLVERRTVQLSELYNRAPCGYHTLDADGFFTSINDTELAWLGYRREELVGRVRAPELMTPETRPAFKANFPRLQREGELNGVEFSFVRKDGSILPVLLQSRAVYDERGTFLHTLSTVIDNSTRLEAERALVAARDEAERANRAKSAFLANMSHEIRTPLNAIIGLTNVMQRARVDGIQSSRLGKIDEAAKHLLGVINDILDLSKIEADRFVLDDVEVDPCSIAAKVAAMLQDRAGRKGLALDFSCDAFPRKLHGDPTRLTQALLNLTANAVKFTERGSVRIRIGKVAEQDDRVLARFEVEDSGIGIDAAALASLFTPFRQVDSTTTRKFGGTGLGLAIVKQLAGLMGGEAGARSAPGAGSTFWFTAWLATGPGHFVSEARNVPGEPAEVAIRTRHTGARVLLAEDEPINQEVAQTLLADAGLDVTVAASGLEAIDLAVAGRYDLVFMDMQMPGMDGVEATLRIRKLPGWESVPIVALTANAFAEDRARCLAAGMNDFLSKPFEPAKLFEMACAWLEARGKSRVSQN